MNEEREPSVQSRSAELHAELVGALIEEHRLIRRLEALLADEIVPSPTSTQAQRVRPELEMEPEL